ncbi:MAG: hypothetical protein CME62_04970 [Halobacteriovoraceae bacterium]|nr:hypothetical protein [Halobacteriovoraceae bacterium]|tara:strand:+ start:3039 stop:3539 length:501 start_codon:yes stop_codon:yes gene_type:complete
MSRRHTHRYKNLWLDKSNSDTESRPGEQFLDSLCAKIDETRGYEEYIHTLCEGMILLLQSKIGVETIKKHPDLMAKIKQLPQKIIHNSYDDSDLMFLGIFVELELPKSIFKLQFYQTIKKLLTKILDCGYHISKTMRQKLKILLRTQNPKRFRQLFQTPHPLKFTG